MILSLCHQWQWMKTFRDWSFINAIQHACTISCHHRLELCFLRSYFEFLSRILSRNFSRAPIIMVSMTCFMMTQQRLHTHFEGLIMKRMNSFEKFMKNIIISGSCSRHSRIFGQNYYSDAVPWKVGCISCSICWSEDTKSNYGYLNPYHSSLWYDASNTKKE